MVVAMKTKTYIYTVAAVFLLLNLTAGLVVAESAEEGGVSDLPLTYHDPGLQLELSQRGQGDHDLDHFNKCETCERIGATELQNMINAFVKNAVGGTCQSVCSLIPVQAAQAICMFGCAYLGFEEFTKFLAKYNNYLDPIDFCDRISACKQTENGLITSGTLQIKEDVIRYPPTVKIGVPFQLVADFDVSSELGAGIVDVIVYPNGDKPGIPLSGGLYEAGFPVGEAHLSFDTTIQPPSASLPFPVPTGPWGANVTVCQLRCDSPYEGAALYSTFHLDFTLES